MNKKYYITILNTISAIAVVFLHTNGCFWSFSRERYWLTANIIESVFYFAVPVFFMISGATLLDYQEKYSTKQFFLKRIKKTVIPFFFWSFIRLFYQIIHKRVDLESITLVSALDGIINGRFINVYWFFPSLFSIYLCFPLLASVPKNKKLTVYGYVLVASFILNCFIPFLITILELPISWPITITVSNGYLFYVIAGYYFANKTYEKRSYRYIYIIGLIGLLLITIGTYKLSMEKGMIINTFKGYTNVPCVLYSLAIFIFVKDNEHFFCNKFIKTIIETISRYTFAIYLLHFYCMEFVKNYLFVTLLHLGSTSIIYRLLSPFPIIILCMIITYILRKIPLLRKLLPE